MNLKEQTLADAVKNRMCKCWYPITGGAHRVNPYDDAYLAGALHGAPLMLAIETLQVVVERYESQLAANRFSVSIGLYTICKKALAELEEARK